MTIVTPTQVVVHPLVLLSVTDHYNRSAKNTKKRVVGVLLGQQIGDTINIANSYAGKSLVFFLDYRYPYSFLWTKIVPFEEDEKDPSVWFLDHNYHEGMYDMFRKVNGNRGEWIHLG